MKRSCNFQMNLAFRAGIVINCVGLLFHNLAQPTGTLNVVCCFVQGFAVGLLGVGLLYGSPKTRPMFDRFHALKLRLLGRAQ